MPNESNQNSPEPSREVLCVAGHVEVDSDDTAALADAARAMMAETHQEDGCLVYELSQDLNRPSRLRVYEEWASGAHLKAHSESDHMGEFVASLTALGVKERSIEAFAGSDFRPI